MMDRKRGKWLMRYSIIPYSVQEYKYFHEWRIHNIHKVIHSSNFTLPKESWSYKKAKREKTLSNAKVLSICLLAIFCTAETSLLPSLHEITIGVFNLASSSLNGLNKSKSKKHFISEFYRVTSKPNSTKWNSEFDSLTCNERALAHWLLCPYRTCRDHWN